jgi:hypothetical protein
MLLALAALSLAAVLAQVAAAAEGSYTCKVTAVGVYSKINGVLVNPPQVRITLTCTTPAFAKEAKAYNPTGAALDREMLGIALNAKANN